MPQQREGQPEQDPDLAHASEQEREEAYRRQREEWRPTGPAECPDCRCTRTIENTIPANQSRYCNHCLTERVRAGEQVPALLPPGPGVEVEEVARERYFHSVCTRCAGTGQVLLTAWQPDTACFGCAGTGFTLASGRSVQRWQRWSSTFQSNRVAKVAPAHRRQQGLDRPTGSRDAR